MKSILLHIGNDNGLEARIQAALDLAREFDGHITCVQSVALEIYTAGDFYGSAISVALPAIREDAEELRRKVERDLSNEDVPWEYVFQMGGAESGLLEKSVINDVVVVGPNEVGEWERYPTPLIGELILHSRTPVLVVPFKHKRIDWSGPALVAWNGSTEACVALRSSVSALAKASKVYLATVSEKKQRTRCDFPPVEGAEYLSRHGIHAEIVEIPEGEASIAETLSSAAQLRECSYMVMGAYGHSRLREFLTGGVTRQALTEPQLPILLAH